MVPLKIILHVSQFRKYQKNYKGFRSSVGYTSTCQRMKMQSMLTDIKLQQIGTVTEDSSVNNSYLLMC